MNYIKRFREISMLDINEVGCANAVIGEISNKLIGKGEIIPDGFAVTTAAYNRFISYNNLDGLHAQLVKTLDLKTFSNLREIGLNARALILNAKMPEDLAEAILDAVKTMFNHNDPAISVLYSSANIKYEELKDTTTAVYVEHTHNILRYIQRCFASLYTDEAIKQSALQNDHPTVAMSVGVLETLPANKYKLFTNYVFNLSEARGLIHLLSESYPYNYMASYDIWNYNFINIW